MMENTEKDLIILLRCNSKKKICNKRNKNMKRSTVIIVISLRTDVNKEKKWILANAVSNLNS